MSDGIYGSLNVGAGSDDDAANIAENRRRVANHFGLPAERLVTMHQTHSADVLTLAEPPDGRPRVDGVVTARPGVALGVLTADCAPVLFADPVAGVVGAAHAGWRGASGGVLEATVDAMVAAGAATERMVAVVGPTIAQPSYEVGPEFVERLTAISPGADDLFHPSPCDGHSLFDLPAYVVRRLAAAGVGTVADLALDTYADEARFFSFRRTTHRGEPDYGRLISVILLEP